MHFDESFCLAFVIILFILLFVRYTKRPISKFFDERAKEIQYKITEAELLQSKTERLLEDYKTMYGDINKVVNDLSVETTKEIDYLKAQALDELEKTLILKKEHALNRIEVKKLNLLKSLKRQAVKISFSTVLILIKQHNYAKINSSLVKSALEDLFEYQVNTKL